MLELQDQWEDFQERKHFLKVDLLPNARPDFPIESNKIKESTHLKIQQNFPFVTDTYPRYNSNKKSSHGMVPIKMFDLLLKKV